MMRDPIVYVVPPNESLKCSMHQGVFEDPVETVCGCTFCRSCILEAPECPIHHFPISANQLRDNTKVQGHLNSLLIHCKGGLQKTLSGEWITNPQACQLWLQRGNRKEHEDVCLHVQGEQQRPPVLACVHREDGCSFVGYTEQDIIVHGAICGYGRLLGQIEELRTQLSQRDLEIERLTNLLTDQNDKNTVSVTLPHVPNVSEMLDSISRGLEKLDHDSTKLFEDAKDTLKATKKKAYKSSLKVIRGIKEVVESAKTEFIAKLTELELIAKDKVRLITTPNTSIHPSTTTTKTTPTPTTTTNVDETTTTGDSVLEKTEIVDDKPVADINNCFNTSQDTPSEETEGDEDLKEFLEASKQEYLQFQAARMAEEEAVRQAMRLSLLDLANKN